jgi:hypothetical protein
MLIGEIVAAVVVTALAVTLLTRRVAHDDVHSVEGYHRSLHTLESINAHPTLSGGGELSSLGEKSAHPESAVRVAGTSTVRVTGTRDNPMTFDDAEEPPAPPLPPPEPRNRDKAMTSINRRPRRLAAPAMAVAGVLVLVVVLLLTGSHAVPPSRTHSPGTNSGHHGSTKPKPPKKKSVSTTSTTPPPAVSSPQAATPESATYDVADSTFTVGLTATSGACWVDATSSATGATLFSGTLAPGGQHSFSATGPVTVIVGAPSVLNATVDGVAVVLPPGFQTPFTMSFAAAGTTPG